MFTLTEGVWSFDSGYTESTLLLRSPKGFHFFPFLCGNQNVSYGDWPIIANITICFSKTCGKVTFLGRLIQLQKMLIWSPKNFLFRNRGYQKTQMFTLKSNSLIICSWKGTRAFSLWTILVFFFLFYKQSLRSE